MTYYNSKEIKDLLENNIEIEILDYENIDELIKNDNYFVEQGRKEINNSLINLKLRKLNKETINNVKKYIENNSSLTKEDILKHFSDIGDIDIIYDLIMKRLMK